MIKYFTTDIIERAKQIADLEDSSFISWNENIALVNEAWTSFYQKLIDKDEANFVKNVQLHYGKNPLPKDFYEVKYVCINNGLDNLLVKRRAKTENFTTLSYDIQHNNIFINGNGGDNIILSYYTVPKTLTYPNSSYDLNLELEEETYIINAYKNTYLIGSYHTGIKPYLYDITSRRVLKELNSEPTVSYMFSNALLSVLPGTTEHLQVIWYAGGEQIDVQGKILVVDNRVYLLKDYDENMLIDVNEVFPPFKKEDDRAVYFDTDSGIKALKLLDTNERYEDLKYVNGFFYTKKGNVLFTLNDELKLVKAKIFNEDIVAVNDINNNSGYGVTVRKNIYNSDIYEYEIQSFADDTLLNFPNNLYFPVIAYDLAKSYKAKQGADFSQIQIKYEDALHQFYDSLSKDANMPIRIANVYQD